MVLLSFVVVMGWNQLSRSTLEYRRPPTNGVQPFHRLCAISFGLSSNVGRTEHAMINAASQKKALRAIPKFVFGLVLCVGLALAAPMLWAYVPSVFWH